jgi:predicted transposase YbfD/YdcC
MAASETRRITVSREVVPTLDWPGAAQVCRIERTRESKGKISHEIVYAITSLPRSKASPDAVLALVREHWSIENRLHWRRDVLMNEDASRIRSGAAPQAMALLRNTMLGIANLFAAPIPAVRMAVAEDRCAAIATVKNGFL